MPVLVSPVHLKFAPGFESPRPGFWGPPVRTMGALLRLLSEQVGRICESAWTEKMPEASDVIQTIRFARIIPFLTMMAVVLHFASSVDAQTEKPPYQLTGFHAIHGSAFMDAIKLSEDRSIGRVSDIE